VLDRRYHAMETDGVAAEPIVRTESADFIKQVEVGLHEEQLRVLEHVAHE
jgi:hypothetical protein